MNSLLGDVERVKSLAIATKLSFWLRVSLQRARRTLIVVLTLAVSAGMPGCGAGTGGSPNRVEPSKAGTIGGCPQVIEWNPVTPTDLQFLAALSRSIPDTLLSDQARVAYYPRVRGSPVVFLVSSIRSVQGLDSSDLYVIATRTVPGEQRPLVLQATAHFGRVALDRGRGVETWLRGCIAFDPLGTIMYEANADGESLAVLAMVGWTSVNGRNGRWVLDRDRLGWSHAE